MSKAAILLADGFEEVEAVTQIDFLRRAGVDLKVVGIGNRDITSARELRVTTDETIDNLDEEFDAVILPGGLGGAKNLSSSEDVNTFLLKMHQEGKLIAAICASPAVVLGPLGLLKDKTYTCYPGFENQVEDGIFSEDRVVIDGMLITSRAPGTAAEFAYEVIRFLQDKTAADKVHEGTLQK